MWNDERIRALTSEFVPATDEVWRLQRGTDPECLHFQRMANQGHYKSPTGTRQGIYIVAPSGKLLASINTLRADGVLQTMERGLAAWEELPAEDRAAPDEAELAPVHRWEDSYPEDGLVLKTWCRDLPADLDPAKKGGKRINQDHAWFTREEARAWLGEDPQVGDEHRVPVESVVRLARFHLVDNVRGQTLPFSKKQVEVADLFTTVVEREGDLVQVKLHGRTRAASKGVWTMGDDSEWAPPAGSKNPRRIEVRLLGEAVFDLGEERFTHFMCVALGYRWGHAWLNGRKPGTSGPLGFVLLLAPGLPADRIAPAFANIYADWVKKP